MESRGWPEGSCFAEVLMREGALLSAAQDSDALAAWRTHLVAEVMDPRSPYPAALRQLNDTASSARAQFLDAWHDLIARALERVSGGQAGGGGNRRGPADDVDAEATAVLVLAAIHGGMVLSRLALDGQPMVAALELALAPLLHM